MERSFAYERRQPQIDCLLRSLLGDQVSRLVFIRDKKVKAIHMLIL